MIRALGRRPHTSNSDPGKQYGVSVGFGRCCCSVLTLPEVAEATATRTGADGVVYLIDSHVRFSGCQAAI